jgi:TrmH family RNA methyltransferase
MAIQLINQHTLLLDGIQDPGNVGTIIRTAHWFGIKNIVLGNQTADAFAPKTVQASMASISAVNIYQTDAISFLQDHKDINAYATSLNGNNLDTLAIPKESIIVFGTEGKGLAENVAEACKYKIRIGGNGGAESLNVGIAAGIICHKFCIG